MATESEEDKKLPAKELANDSRGADQAQFNATGQFSSAFDMRLPKTTLSPKKPPPITSKSPTDKRTATARAKAAKSLAKRLLRHPADCHEDNESPVDETPEERRLRKNRINDRRKRARRQMKAEYMNEQRDHYTAENQRMKEENQWLRQQIVVLKSSMQNQPSTSQLNIPSSIIGASSATSHTGIPLAASKSKPALQGQTYYNGVSSDLMLEIPLRRQVVSSQVFPQAAAASSFMGLNSTQSHHEYIRSQMNRKGFGRIKTGRETLNRTGFQGESMQENAFQNLSGHHMSALQAPRPTSSLGGNIRLLASSRKQGSASNLIMQQTFPSVLTNSIDGSGTNQVYQRSQIRADGFRASSFKQTATRDMNYLAEESNNIGDLNGKVTPRQQIPEELISAALKRHLRDSLQGNLVPADAESFHVLLASLQQASNSTNSNSSPSWQHLGSDAQQCRTITSNPASFITRYNQLGQEQLQQSLMQQQRSQPSYNSGNATRQPLNTSQQNSRASVANQISIGILDSIRPQQQDSTVAVLQYLALGKEN